MKTVNPKSNFGPVLYCGDPHGEFGQVIKAATELHASAVVLLGDVDAARPLWEELEPIVDRLWFIHGNHDADTDANWLRITGKEIGHRNIHGRVVTLPDGTRLAGLGGVFREAVWYPGLHGAAGDPKFRSRGEHGSATPKQNRWKHPDPAHGAVGAAGHPKLSDNGHRRHFATIYPDELDRLADLRADVLITHEAPGYHPNGFEILDTLAQVMGVKATVHGHHHDCLDSSARWAAQGFASFGVGLRGVAAIENLNGLGVTAVSQRIIVPGALDLQRSYRSKNIAGGTDSAEDSGSVALQGEPLRKRMRP